MRIDQLEKQISEVEKYINQPEKKYSDISNWSTYMQSEHILTTCSQILSLIEKGEEPAEPKRRSLLSYVVFLSGYIPRGNAEAPKHVIPDGKTSEELKQMLLEVRNKLTSAKNNELLNSPVKVGNHPYFGSLDRLEWIRFMEIHNNHHLKIINDILNS